MVETAAASDSEVGEASVAIIVLVGTEIQPEIGPEQFRVTTASHGTSNLRVQSMGGIQQRWHHFRPVLAMQSSQVMV